MPYAKFSTLEDDHTTKGIEHESRDQGFISQCLSHSLTIFVHTERYVRSQPCFFTPGECVAASKFERSHIRIMAGTNSIHLRIKSHCLCPIVTFEFRSAIHASILHITCMTMVSSGMPRYLLHPNSVSQNENYLKPHEDH